MFIFVSKFAFFVLLASINLRCAKLVSAEQRSTLSVMLVNRLVTQCNVSRKS